MDDHPAKRLKAMSTFEHLSIEIILNIFEYLNANEILQSFSNLNSFIASCLSNQHHRIHLHLNDEMISLPENYSPGQVISLRIDKIVISIGQFINLKSLFIIYKCDWENYCLNMIMEISKLSQLINFRLLLVGSEMATINQTVLGIALYHPSIQRIVLSKNHSKPFFYICRKNSSVKLAFIGTELAYATRNFVNFGAYLFYWPPTPQYHVQHLDMNFKSWKFHLFANCLSALPSLITLKIIGFCCCNHAYGWLGIERWDEILQKLPALQQVAIDIYLALPFSSREKAVNKFNEYAEQRIETCKRVNLKAGKPIEKFRGGDIEITASLNMN